MNLALRRLDGKCSRCWPDGKPLEESHHTSQIPLPPPGLPEIPVVLFPEVSVRSDVACPTGTEKDDWDAAVNTAYTSANSDWQVMFQRAKEQSIPMNLSSCHNTQVNIGVNGEFLEQTVAEERGYIVEKRNATVQISIPYNADGGYRKSFVTDDLYEYYIFHLCLEHLDGIMALFIPFLATPLLCPVFTENKTVNERHMFTVYLGDVCDVELAAVHLNGHKYTVPFTNTSGHTITKVVHPNNTHGYTLKVPFDDPVVLQQGCRGISDQVLTPVPPPADTISTGFPIQLRARKNSTQL
ncbi:uncharacterized protein AKAME5_002220900 [Lates japonicus]|uniref:ZP-domain containing protein Ig-like domain-containing protein n=1 Tax=Lates japonicus TaxID=270547 RepID=A0AAD3RK50_LATJO|nr:uncharacterized protein AKAME5_002220900 [Lates japonicus]